MIDCRKPEHVNIQPAFLFKFNYFNKTRSNGLFITSTKYPIKSLPKELPKSICAKCRSSIVRVRLSENRRKCQDDETKLFFRAANSHYANGQHVGPCVSSRARRVIPSIDLSKTRYGERGVSRATCTRVICTQALRTNTMAVARIS